MHPRVIFVIESRNCNLFQAIWGAICWRGPASNNSLLEVELANNESANCLSTPNPVFEQSAPVQQQPQADLQHESTGQEAASAAFQRNNMGGQQESENKIQWRRHYQMQRTKEREEGRLEIPVASPLPEHKSTGEEEEGTGERADVNENSSCSLPNGIMQQVLSIGIVQATFIRHEAPNRRYDSSERCHLLQQMSSTGLLYKGENSIV